jgi:hypothetical protein
MGINWAMSRRHQLSDPELEELSGHARNASAHAATARAFLGGRFPADVAEFYACAPSDVVALVAEIRRLRGELQHSLSLSVVRVDGEGQSRQGDVGEVGKMQRGKRSADVDDAGRNNRRNP